MLLPQLPITDTRHTRKDLTIKFKNLATRPTPTRSFVFLFVLFLITVTLLKFANASLQSD